MPDVNLSPSGPPETVLPDPDPSLIAALDDASSVEGCSAIVAQHPSSLIAWASLGEVIESRRSDAADDIAAYAAFRVGYHRGLDALRRNGWKGSGYVRWEYPSNRGFLRCLDGLSRMAGVIGEDDEHIRCAEFLRMLDPDWDRRSQ
jgi:hypothetical protein